MGFGAQIERLSTWAVLRQGVFSSVVYIIVEVLKLLEHPGLGLRLTNAATR